MGKSILRQKNPYFQSEYFKICNEYAIDPKETWISGG